MKIVPANQTDLRTIFDLYDKAIEFQKTVFYKSWLEFDRKMVETEVDEGRLWKILEANEIACIYSVTYADPIVWGEFSDRSAMYIHRIVTNPEFRGRGYAFKITEWAIDHARAEGLRFIRMDTWSDNQKLIDYYQKCGFRFAGTVEPAESENLPKHYSSISMALFEIDLEDD